MPAQWTLTYSDLSAHLFKGMSALHKQLLIMRTCGMKFIYTTKESAKESLRFCDSSSRLPTILGMFFQDDAEWLSLLGKEWEGFDNVGVYLDELLQSPFGELLRQGPIVEMMTEQEQHIYEELPDLVTIYRGCFAINKRGLCWTTDINVAKKIPTLNRYRQAGQPLLIKAVAKKKNVLAVKLGREEMEIITYRPTQKSISFIR